MRFECIGCARVLLSRSGEAYHSIVAPHMLLCRHITCRNRSHLGRLSHIIATLLMYVLLGTLRCCMLPWQRQIL